MQTKLQALEKQCTQDPTNENVKTQIQKVKRKLEIISIERAKGAQIRSGTKQVEEGEKNTKYRLNLEKSRTRKNIMGNVKRKW